MIARTLIAAALAAAAAATPAAAAEPFEFRYKSYELETQGGRADLKARLDRMVERYCAAGEVRNISARRAAAECRATTMAAVLSKIDNVEFARLDR